MRIGILAAAAVVAAFCGLGSAYADGNAQFAYQGRVKVQGQEFDGDGFFKFAIVNTPGAITLWSHNGTGEGGAEPAGAGIVLAVEEGVFNVIMGDTESMEPINGTIFSAQTPPKLRVWFSDGVHGFQQMHPDHNLVNVTVIETGTADFTIYVNGASGNDAHNGLSPQKAKKTIQGAVDVLPGRIKCNVTVDIAPGVYREQVQISGVSTAGGKTLKFLGDDTWTGHEDLLAKPDVRVCGRDSDSVGAPVVRPNVFMAHQCSGLVIEGIHFEYGSGGDFGTVQLEDGRYNVNRCLISNAHWGLNAVQAVGEYYGCRAENNTAGGLCVTMQSRFRIKDCVSRNNDRGVYVAEMSVAQFWQSGDYSDNAIGCNIIGTSSLGVWPAAPGVTVKIQDNSTRGLILGWDGTYEPTARVILSGNGDGDDNYELFKGGRLYQ